MSNKMIFVFVFNGKMFCLLYCLQLTVITVNILFMCLQLYMILLDLFEYSFFLILNLYKFNVLISGLKKISEKNGLKYDRYNIYSE